MKQFSTAKTDEIKKTLSKIKEAIARMTSFDVRQSVGSCIS